MVIKPILPSVIVCVLSLVIAGCSGAPDWVGTYVGEQKGLLENSAPDDVIAATLRRVTLEIKPDMSFTLTKAGFPVEGQIILSGKTARLKVESILGSSIESEPESVQESYSRMKLERVDDDTLVLSDPDDFNRPPIELTREADQAE